ncbi:MAG TPA: glycerate kinase [Anaerovoracaceae bacterium]|nr:glycerate kinase [Anaerovoracaceae bacterium]
MKIVIAPDSYKGSLTAKEACAAMKRGVLKAAPDAEIVTIPMSDGGEGTTRSLVDSLGGEMFPCKVLNPLGEIITAEYGILSDNTAVIEMAEASGLTLIGKEQRDPMKSTTYGTGEMIKDALDQGCRNFILGIGGSATNDGGAGMAQALGYRLLDRNGRQIPLGGAGLAETDRIDKSAADPRIGESKFTVACDVDNPLCGENGASSVFGPQKGATAEMIGALDKNLGRFADIIERDMGIYVKDTPGAGAAGGLGAGMLAFLDANLRKGVDIVIDAVGLKSGLIGADLVITGEGGCDFQTVKGKTPYGVAKTAQQLGIPAVIIAGQIGKGAEALYDHGVVGIFTLVNGPVSLDYAIENAESLLEDAAARTVHCLSWFMEE